ncbi:MAG: thioredoxin domain-containing protein [Bacteroidetes bacterium]|nr:thioredoxin domain-containing protein [Rhodothermia bacterium]MCX7907451.1 thioredoxin domain-containing protein [Bacteroidota bacterium]MDW8138445.1 thioredoxin domain-containing protein [Bacteroidota bacterium]MDW8284618.1 thioredoxin domain-containing protein [Bacteroidota bacterium]
MSSAQPNRLIRCASPYLRQHAYNPVDWYPWGEEAFERARREDKPILLSVGYASCHWCHVMERESFEDEAIAALMNAHFVCVKVDREERPDVDAVYMQAVQAMTGHGGWPLTVFLTPEGAPFYGGTYFPPEPRAGLPAFRQVLEAVATAWRTRREAIQEAAQTLLAHLEAAARRWAEGELSPGLLDRSYAELARQFDSRYGGFGGAPKFPQAMTLRFLLRYGWRAQRAEALQMVHFSLIQMAHGGIYDQLGGGFHRYAVDARWRIPHFEKMLYDNALLAWTYLEAWQLTREPEFRWVLEQTLTYLLREMRHEAGAFFSAQDADSEGQEGLYYTWTLEELRAVLGPHALRAAAYYGVSREGNFEGRNVLFRPFTEAEFAALQGLEASAWARERETIRTALLETRTLRRAPERDEKILASWNGMAVLALAQAGRALGRPDWLEAAQQAGRFLWTHLVQGGRVYRSWTHGERLELGFLEDYAWLGLAALSLYEATWDRMWLERARTLAEALCAEFWDTALGGFCDTLADHDPHLPIRPRERTDQATPAGASVAAELLCRLAAIWDEPLWRERARETAASVAELMGRYPGAFGHLLGVSDALIYGLREVVLLGPAGELAPLRQIVDQAYLPDLVLAHGPGENTQAEVIPLLRGRRMLGGRPTAYVCRNFTCLEPTTDPERFRAQLGLSASEAL